jgi:hypothetical protein
MFSMYDIYMPKETQKAYVCVDTLFLIAFMALQGHTPRPDAVFSGSTSRCSALAALFKYICRNFSAP